MVLGHSLPELRKSVLSLVVTGAALLAFFVKFDPHITAGVTAVVIACFGVATVYNRPHSYDDISKAIGALIASGVALYGFFHIYNPGDQAQLIAIGAAVLNVGGVFFITNKPAGT